MTLHHHVNQVVLLLPCAQDREKNHSCHGRMLFVLLKNGPTFCACCLKLSSFTKRASFGIGIVTYIFFCILRYAQKPASRWDLCKQEPNEEPPPLLSLHGPIIIRRCNPKSAFSKKSNSICSNCQGFDLRTGFLRKINANTFFRSACSEYFCAMKSTVRQQNDTEHADPIFRPSHLLHRTFKTA